MKRKKIDLDALLAPIPGDNPGGEDLRYDQEYDRIKEARRYDDPLDQGEWKTEIKKADWDKTVDVALQALAEKTKDLQIAVWLAEGLIMTQGFEGCLAGLKVINGLLEHYWDHLYPPLDGDDVEYRIAPLELMNEKLAGTILQVPITDPGRTAGYSWIKWQESRQVGYDTESRDDGARQRREEAIAEGKPTADQFEAAAASTAPTFYKALLDTVSSCLEEFGKLDRLVDERFGRDAPRLSEFGKALEDVNQLTQRLCKDKGILVSANTVEPGEEPSYDGNEQASEAETEEGYLDSPALAPAGTVARPAENPSALVDAVPWEQTLWDEAMRTLKSAGAPKALEKVMEAALSSPSVRGQSRHKLHLAKLCLQAGRPDLARPILEQLYALIDELRLQQWESPVWIADVVGALYQCLTSADASDEDLYRAQELFQRLCTIDITKAIAYRR